MTTTADSTPVIQLLCNAAVLLYSRSKTVADLTGHQTVHTGDLAMVRALHRAGWHQYDATGPCPVCGRTDLTRHYGFHSKEQPAAT